MSTKNKWLIGIGIVLLLAAMYALPFVLQSTTAPAYGGGYGMMGGGRGGMGGGMMGDYGDSSYGGYAMHGGGYGMMGYNNGISSWLWMGLMWLIPVSLLALIGLAIASLIKYLRSA